MVFALLVGWARSVLGCSRLGCDARVRHVHQMLQSSHGQMRIAALCKDLGFASGDRLLEAAANLAWERTIAFFGENLN